MKEDLSNDFVMMSSGSGETAEVREETGGEAGPPSGGGGGGAALIRFTARAENTQHQ